jgi:hypothetical protein
MSARFVVFALVLFVAMAGLAGCGMSGGLPSITPPAPTPTSVIFVEAPPSSTGTTYVFGADGLDEQGGLQIAGVMTLNSGGTVTGFLNWNDLSKSAPQAPAAFTGTYTVDPTGRVTITKLTDGATFTYSMHLYLNGQGSGILLSSDSNDVFNGQLFEQQSSVFSVSSFTGSYGMNASVYNSSEVEGPLFGNAVGPVAVTPNAGDDVLTGFADYGVSAPDFAISGSFTPAANGVFTGSLTGFGIATPANSSPFVLYLIDGTQGLAIETDNSQLTLARFALAQ